MLNNMPNSDPSVRHRTEHVREIAIKPCGVMIGAGIDTCSLGVFDCLVDWNHVIATGGTIQQRIE